MSISMYDFSIPMLTRGLTNLSAILDKGAAHAETKKFDSVVLAQARLAGVEAPKHEDNETTFAELKARIAKTLDFVKTITPAQLKDAETRDIEIKFPNGSWKFTGLKYLTEFALPNLYFHESMAYALLRKSGVDVGKMDYLGAIQ